MLCVSIVGCGRTCILCASAAHCSLMIVCLNQQAIQYMRSVYEVQQAVEMQRTRP